MDELTPHAEEDLWRLLLAGPEDLLGLRPTDLPDPFTTADLATQLRRPRRTAQEMASCFRLVGALVGLGKPGHAVAYRGQVEAHRNGPR